MGYICIGKQRLGILLLVVKVIRSDVLDTCGMVRQSQTFHGIHEHSRHHIDTNLGTAIGNTLLQHFNLVIFWAPLHNIAV